MANILMCPPDHFGIEYEINPWMNRTMASVSDQAFRQWQNLKNAITEAGAGVEQMTPRPGLPDLVFTANAGLVSGQRFFSSRFRHAVRAGETPFFDEWFRDHGFEVVTLPGGYYFEGAGDALFCGDTLFAGYRTRSDAVAHQWIAECIGVRVLPLELVNPRFYHLDTCFCPLSSTEAIYFPEAFDAYGMRVLQRHVETLIPLTEDDAFRFGCNAVVIGKRVIHNAGCPALGVQLAANGYQSVEVALDEFLKAGGAAKCLTFRVDGEDAAPASGNG